MNAYIEESTKFGFERRTADIGWMEMSGIYSLRDSIAKARGIDRDQLMIVFEEGN